MKNKFIKIVSFSIYLLSLAQVAKRTILSETLEYSPWSFSELLVSYPDQFTRRGLIGEIVQSIDQDSILFDTVNMVVFVNFTFFILLSFLLIKLSNLTSIQHFIYLISVFGIFNITLFNMYYPRKEIFVLNLFMFVLLTIRLTSNINIILITMSICSILMILIHEGIAMISIPFIIYICKEYLRIPRKILYIYSTIISVVFLTVIISAGSDIASEAIWNELSEFDKSQIVIHPNAITAIGWSLFDSFFLTTQVLIFSGSMFLWTFYLLLFAITLTLIFKGKPYGLSFKVSTIQSFLLKEKYFLVIPVLFIVGFDWGRWIFTLFHLCFFSYLILKKDNIEKISNWSLPIISLIVVSLLTIMPECCLQMSGTTVSSNYYRVFKSIQITIQSLLN
ncbi:hypothetical protein N9T02_01190 [Candidatus Actinomarina]|nr:hypothetical protein [Candidatus Actinomarina sp.]|tara:strand:- start:16032 stop:17207 length:1176 start_codon:yes stop_codon:yes gene_type:complete